MKLYGITRKSSKIVLLAAILFVVGIGTGYAMNNWAGHENETQTSNNLDKLGGQLSKNQTDLKNAGDALKQAQNGQNDLKNQLASLQTQYNQLNDQKNSEEQSLQVQIQQKIAETQQAIVDGNNKVALKQQEVDALNKKYQDLQSQMENQKQSFDADMQQAIQDAQNNRNKSDQLVNQYVGK